MRFRVQKKDRRFGRFLFVDTASFEKKSSGMAISSKRLSSAALA
jgi:hypothetical protein